MDRMIRKATYAGKPEEKDNLDIFYWANKSPQERLSESWRLNCINHNLPINIRLDKTHMSAKKRLNG